MDDTASPIDVSLIFAISLLVKHTLFRITISKALSQFQSVNDESPGNLNTNYEILRFRSEIGLLPFEMVALCDFSSLVSLDLNYRKKDCQASPATADANNDYLTLTFLMILVSSPGAKRCKCAARISFRPIKTSFFPFLIA